MCTAKTYFLHSFTNLSLSKSNQCDVTDVCPRSNNNPKLFPNNLDNFFISIDSANNIISLNPSLKDKVEIRQQFNTKFKFFGIIKDSEQFHLSICNPPFHSSAEEAQRGSQRKMSNLKKKHISKSVGTYCKNIIYLAQKMAMNESDYIPSAPSA